MYEAKPECVILFTECDFKGEQYEICQDSASFSTVIHLLIAILRLKLFYLLNQYKFQKIWQ